jgi:probable F420-dependent oxidoreductase
MSTGVVGLRITPEDRLVFGLQLPVVAQTGVLTQPWELEAGATEILRVAQAADRLGYFYVSACDHVCIPRDKAAAMSTAWYDPVATLGFVAAATRCVRLLTSVLVLPYRHPLLAAKQFATLDALSGGRVILGVGAGHVEAEFAQLGVDFTQRGKLTDEAIDLVRAAFLAEYPEHTGPLWSVREMGQKPRPLQQPRPPIWVGGNTPAALKRVARRADGWIPQGTFRDQFPQQLATIRAYREAAHGHAPLDVGATSEWMYVGTPAWDVPAGTRSGTPAALAEPLRELKALGATHVSTRFRTRSCDELIDQLAAFATQVAPLVNA